MAEITQKVRDALRREYAEQATDEQFELWMAKCEREDLVPVEDVVLQIRTVSEFDPETRAKVRRKRPIYITTVRALTKIASRTGKYKGKGQTEWIYLDSNNQPTIVSPIPLADAGNPSQPARPWAARVPVRHADFTEPVVEVVRFDAYAQTVNRDGGTFLNSTWSTRGPEQLAKCGFAASLRASFPEAGDLYLAEELERRDADHADPTPSAPAAPVTPLPTLATAPATVEVKSDPAPVPENNVNLTKTEEHSQPTEAEPQPLPKVLTINQQLESHGPHAIPDQEERKAHLNKLRTYKVDRESMRRYLEAAHGVTDTKALNKTFTVGQWAHLFTVLDKAVADNTLEALVKGELKQEQA